MINNVSYLGGTTERASHSLVKFADRHSLTLPNYRDMENAILVRKLRPVFIFSSNQ